MTLATRAALSAAALLVLGAADARAQLIELPMGAGTPQGLTAHQIRVVQFALRDTDCYDGPITGRWTAATRNALQCARERTNTTDGQSLALELGLWAVEGMPTRNAGGDVAPMAGALTMTPMLAAAVDSLTMAAEGGITNVSPERLGLMLDNLAMRFAEVDNPTFATIATDLRGIRSSLMMQPLQPAVIGRQLVDVSDKLEIAAGGMSGDTRTKLMRLSTALDASGRSLAP